MDKEYMKLLMSARGLPVGRYVVVRDRDWRSGEGERKRVLDEIAELGWPVFVKPARGGSSIGISRVTVAGDLEVAIETARAHDPKVLVEAAVDGSRSSARCSRASTAGRPRRACPARYHPDRAAQAARPAVSPGLQARPAVTPCSHDRGQFWTLFRPNWPRS
jgi:hypothetical protein